MFSTIFGSKKTPTASIPPKTSTDVNKVDQKISEAPKSFSEKISEAKLTSQYYAIELNDKTAGSTRQALFGKKLLASTHNRGQKEDLEAFASKTKKWENERTLAYIGKRLKIRVGEETKIDPYGSGNCFGGALIFCKAWLKLPDSAQNLDGATPIIQEFKKGIPAEGVVAQAVYDRLYSANIDKQGLISPQTTHSVQVAATAYNELTLKEYNVEDGSPQEMIDFAKSCKPGAYMLVVPTYGPAGGKNGRHDLAFIKIDDELSLLYDPNYGIGYEDEGKPEEIMKRAVETYVGPLSSGTTTAEKAATAWRKVGNFFSGAANPPLFSEIKSGCDVYRLET